jgi:cell division transport system permease protein
MFGFMLSEAVRDLRRAGRVAVSAVILITFSLVALGGFWVLSTNLGEAVAQWRDRVRIIVYLKREPATAEVPAVLARVRALDGVLSAVYVGKGEALDSLRRVLGKDATVLDHLPSNPLPASIEVTLTPAAATPEGTRAMISRLAQLPEVDEVAGGVEWVERLAHWQRLLSMIGLGVGSLLAIAAIMTVTTATTLVLYARRHETEIMRLVGAAEILVRLPLLLQGMLQGLIGGVLALLALTVAHRLAAPHLDPVLNVTMGLPGLQFLSPVNLALLLAAGTLLGAFGGWLARGPGRWR